MQAHVPTLFVLTAYFLLLCSRLCPFDNLGPVESLGWSPWRPTLKWRGSGVGQGRSSQWTVLANGARFIRPFGLGFIKTAGEDIPGDSINQSSLVTRCQANRFQTSCVKPLSAPPPPQTQRLKSTYTQYTLVDFIYTCTTTLLPHSPSLTQ